MSAMMISCIAVGGAGVLVALLSIPFLTSEKRITKKCSASTIGTVVDYKKTYGSAPTSISPLVEFYIDGVQHMAYRHYRGVVTSKNVPKKADESNMRFEIFVSENDWFCKRQTGTYFDLTSQAKELWPIGSNLVVVYNPDKPKQAYVEKVVTKTKIAGVILMIVGTLFVLIAMLVLLISG